MLAKNRNLLGLHVKFPVYKGKNTNSQTRHQKLLVWIVVPRPYRIGRKVLLWHDKVSAAFEWYCWTSNSFQGTLHRGLTLKKSECMRQRMRWKETFNHSNHATPVSHSTFVSVQACSSGTSVLPLSSCFKHLESQLMFAVWPRSISALFTEPQKSTWWGSDS